MRATEFVTENFADDKLYHATYRPFLASIIKNGLGGKGAQTQWEDSTPGYVYLAKDPQVAISHAEANENVSDEYIDNIVVLAIDINQLDTKRLDADPNILDDDSTLAYKGVIPSSALQTHLIENFADGKDKISFKVKKGKNKFATTLTVNNTPAGVYQYNADTGRSIAEIIPEFRSHGLGKILVLHAIYTAAQLGMDFQEDESRTNAYDRVLDSLSSSGYIVDDDGYWYVTGEGEQFLNTSLNENFADGKVKGKSRPGRVKRAGASCSGSVTDLRKRAKNASGEKAKMYHWCANMKSGSQKKK